MAKKLGKALLFTAAIGLTATAAYLYFKKKNDMYFTDMDEDFDDTYEDDIDSEEPRSYVELPKEAAPTQEIPVSEEAKEPPAAESPVPEEAKGNSAAEDTASEELIPDTVEEFFNEKNDGEN